MHNLSKAFHIILTQLNMILIFITALNNSGRPKNNKSLQFYLVIITTFLYSVHWITKLVCAKKLFHLAHTLNQTNNKDIVLIISTTLINSVRLATVMLFMVNQQNQLNLSVDILLQTYSMSTLRTQYFNKAIKKQIDILSFIYCITPLFYFIFAYIFEHPLYIIEVLMLILSLNFFLFGMRQQFQVLTFSFNIIYISDQLLKTQKTIQPIGKDNIQIYESPELQIYSPNCFDQKLNQNQMIIQNQTSRLRQRSRGIIYLLKFEANTLGSSNFMNLNTGNIHQDQKQIINFPIDSVQHGYVIIDQQCQLYYYNKQIFNQFEIQTEQDLIDCLKTLKVNEVCQKSQNIFRMSQDNSECRRNSVRSKNISSISDCQKDKVNTSLQDYLRAIQFSKPFINSINIVDFEIKHINTDKFFIKIRICPQSLKCQLKDQKEKMLFIIEVFDVEEKLIETSRKKILIIMKQLFRSFSHEFSTSLNGIQSIAQAAIDSLQGQDVILDTFIKPILNSSLIMNSTVQDIRDYSMLQQNLLVLKIQIIDLKGVVESCFNLFSEQFKMRKIDIQYKSKYNELIEIQTDIERLKQIIVNLLSNAQKNTQNVGHVKLSVSEIQRGNKRFIKIKVTDTGNGMDEEEKQSVKYILDQSFQKSYQKERYKNFGLGLMISNHLAMTLSKLKRSQDGGIFFKSEVPMIKILIYKINKGSSFWFLIMDKITESECHVDQTKICTDYERNRNLKQKQDYSCSIKLIQIFNLPILEEEDVQQENDLQDIEQVSIMLIDLPNISMPQSITNKRHQKKQINKCSCKKIIVIDDEFINIKALQLLLHNQGQEIDFAYDGQEGYYKVIERFKNPCIICLQGYILIFMDINMPICNGLESTQKILRYYDLITAKRPIIIAQTADADAETQRSCFQSGMKYFLSKPIKKKELVDIIKYYGL